MLICLLPPYILRLPVVSHPPHTDISNGAHRILTHWGVGKDVVSSQESPGHLLVSCHQAEHLMIHCTSDEGSQPGVGEGHVQRAACLVRVTGGRRARRLRLYHFLILVALLSRFSVSNFIFLHCLLFQALLLLYGAIFLIFSRNLCPSSVQSMSKQKFP